MNSWAGVPGRAHERRWRFPARADQVSRARHEVRGFAAANGAPDSSLDDISIAVSEATTNAVMHAFLGADEGEIEVRVEVGDGELVIRVIDSGGGMRPRIDSPGIGLGMPMMGKLAKRVDVMEGPGGLGTEVRMAFRIPELRVRGAGSPGEPDRVALLGSVLDAIQAPGWPEAGVGPLLAILVPELADACVVDVFDEDGELQRLGALAAGPHSGERSSYLTERTPDPAEMQRALEVVRAGKPRLLELDDDALDRLSNDSGDRDRLADFGYSHWLNLPLRDGVRLLGTLGFGFKPERREVLTDLDFLMAVADRASAGFANAELVAGLRRRHRRLDGILGSLADAVIVQQPGNRLVYANKAAVEFFGARRAEEVLDAEADELYGRFVVTAEDGSAIDAEELPGRRILRGERDPEPLLARFVEKVSGREQWVLIKARALEQGGPLAVTTVQDITESKRAELRQRFLAEAGGILLSGAEPGVAVSRIADLAVPLLADWCLVDLIGDGDRYDRVAVSSVDRRLVDYARGTHERWPIDPHARLGPVAVMRSGKPELHTHVTDEMIAAVARHPDHEAFVRKLGIRSVLAVPIECGHGTCGALTLLATESERRLGQADLEFAGELARRIAAAVAD